MDSWTYGPFAIPIVAIVGAFTYGIIRTLASARVRELEIKERIAMIERGLVPAPETDPRGFDRAMQRLERMESHRREFRDYRSSGGGRHRRAGVTLMGVGFGLMVLIGFADHNPETAVGVGGFLVVMGLAFLINGLIERSTDVVHSTGGMAPPPPPTTPAPPPQPPRQD
jgi:hypothetical protein